MTAERAPWVWRMASGGWTAPNETDDARRFHAYDTSDRMACTPHLCLAASVAEPFEGADLCQDCMGVVRTVWRGRDPSLSSMRMYTRGSTMDRTEGFIGMAATSIKVT